MQALSEAKRLGVHDCVPGDEALRSKIQEAILLLEEEEADQSLLQFLKAIADGAPLPGEERLTLSSDVAWQVLAFALSRPDFPLIFNMISSQLQNHENHLQHILWLTFRSIYRDDVDDYHLVRELLHPWVPIISDRPDWAEYFAKNQESNEKQFTTTSVLRGDTVPLETIFRCNSSKRLYASDLEIAVRFECWHIAEHLHTERYWEWELMHLSKQGLRFSSEIAPLYMLRIIRDEIDEDWMGDTKSAISFALSARDHHVLRAALSRQWEVCLLDGMEQRHISKANGTIAQTVAEWCQDDNTDWKGQFKFASHSDMIEYILDQCLVPNDSYSLCYLAGFLWVQCYNDSLLMKRIIERAPGETVGLHEESDPEQQMELIFQRYPPQDDQLKWLFRECCVQDDEDKAMFLFRKNPPLLIQQFDQTVYDSEEPMVANHYFYFAIEWACFVRWRQENVLFMFESGAYDERNKAEDLGECPARSILKHADDELIQWIYNAGYVKFPLHGLCRSERSEAVSCARQFLDQHETDVNCWDESPLHLACSRANLDMVELLRSRPASEQFLTHQDRGGEIPLFRAIRAGSLSVARKMMPLLIPDGHSSLHFTDKEQSNLLHICAKYNPRLLPEIIPLMSSEHFSAKSDLCPSEWYFYFARQQNVPLLLLICRFTHEDVPQALRKGESLEWIMEIVRMFIEEGGPAQILAPNTGGLTAWHALFSGKSDIYFPLFHYFLEQVADSFHADDQFIRQLASTNSLANVPVIVELLRYQIITNEQFDEMALNENVREAIQAEIGARKKAKSMR